MHQVRSRQPEMGAQFKFNRDLAAECASTPLPEAFVSQSRLNLAANNTR